MYLSIISVCRLLGGRPAGGERDRGVVLQGPRPAAAAGVGEEQHGPLGAGVGAVLHRQDGGGHGARRHPRQPALQEPQPRHTRAQRRQDKGMPSFSLLDR